MDAGHGGNDPQREGPDRRAGEGHHARRRAQARAILAKQGIQITLTRDDDRYVTLEERTARRTRSAPTSSSPSTATRPSAPRSVASDLRPRYDHQRHGRSRRGRENATSQAASNEVAQLLASMRLADQASRSTRFGGALAALRGGVARHAVQRITDGGLHRAAFYVLVGARMPAVLFEIATSRTRSRSSASPPPIISSASRTASRTR